MFVLIQQDIIQVNIYLVFNRIKMLIYPTKLNQRNHKLIYK